jgi:GNAT superfamily N-acetyltransferase
MARINLRLAQRGEGQAILDLLRCTSQGARHSFNFGSAHEVERLIANGIFLLAENDNKLLGCAYLEPRVEASRLELLAVCPSRRRAGIGSQLLELAEDMSRRRECLFMHVRISNMNYATLMFYRRRGYVEFAIEATPSEGASFPACHLIAMAKRLENLCHGF